MKAHRYTGVHKHKEYLVGVAKLGDVFYHGWFKNNVLDMDASMSSGGRAYKIFATAQHSLDKRADDQGWRYVDTIDSKAILVQKGV